MSQIEVAAAARSSDKTSVQMGSLPIAYRSSTSQHSRSISHFLSSDVDELSDDELVRRVNALKASLKILTIENEILERTIMRIEPALMYGVQQAHEYACKMQASSSLTLGSFIKSGSKFFDSVTSPSRMLGVGSPSRVSTKKVESSARISGTIISGTGPKINVVERTELAVIEMEILAKYIERFRARAAKKHALMKAQMEEVTSRVIDIDRATEMFNQEVVIEGWDKITQRIPAEAFIRFIMEWAKTCDSKIGKLRLRTSTLNTQFAKLKGMIKVKAELSESLRPVDFEKLKIENMVAQDTIELKKRQLGELKKMAGDANLNLTIHKKQMMEQNAYLSNLLASIDTKLKTTVQIDKETVAITNQADTLAQQLEEVKQLRLAYEVPDIMEYVQIKNDLADLAHVVKMLENRAHVQQIALNSLKKLNQKSFT